MKKILLALAIAIFTPNMGKSQQTFSAEESDTASLTQEEIEEAKEKLAAALRKDQVLSIANVDFGTSRKEAERKLKKNLVILLFCHQIINSILIMSSMED